MTHPATSTATLTRFYRTALRSGLPTATGPRYSLTPARNGLHLVIRRMGRVALSEICEDDAHRTIAIACCAGRAKLRARQNIHELETQIGPGRTHRFGYVAAYVCHSQRKCAARRSTGSVSRNRWRVGDFRFALCETQIEAGSRPYAKTERLPQCRARLTIGPLVCVGETAQLFA